MSKFVRPGASLFGRSVERSRHRQSSAGTKDEEYGDSEHEPSASMDYSESDDESDAGTILSTRESSRRTPEQLRKENTVKKQALLLELTQMKRDGVQLSREYTDEDDIELMSYEIERHKQTQNENTMVGMFKVGLNMGCHGLQMLNQVKGPWIPMKGWAEAVTADMNVYDRPLRRIHRQYFSRGPAGNPWIELGFALIGSLVFHVMVAKMMGTTNGATMFAKMFQGSNGGPPGEGGGNGGGGGMMGAMSGMMGMMGGTGPARGVPQPVPNAGNPFPNKNVPAPRVPVSAPPPASVCPPMQSPVRAPAKAPRRGRRPMRRPSTGGSPAPRQLMRPPGGPVALPDHRPTVAHPPTSSASAPMELGSESSINLDDTV